MARNKHTPAVPTPPTVKRTLFLPPGTEVLEADYAFSQTLALGLLHRQGPREARHRADWCAQGRDGREQQVPQHGGQSPSPLLPALPTPSLARYSHSHPAQAKTWVASANALAVSKPPLLALLTNTGSNGSAASWEVPGAGFSANEALVEVLTCNTMTADGNGGISAKSNGGMPQVRLL